MTNYFGRVTTQSLNWNKDNVFTQIPKGTFWLTNLNAWKFLTVDAKTVEANSKDIVTKMAQGSLPEEECPLTNPSGNLVLDQDVNKLERYKLLSSTAFFNWLKKQNTSLLSDEAASALCKDKPRPGRLPYSLSQMGYKPAILNRSLKRLDNTNMLDVPFSRIYRPLQFLEGVYYATQIIQSNQNSEQGPSVVFLTPNKEFTYSLVPGEQKPFATFQTCVNKVLQQKEYTGKPATIYQIPFAYGGDLFDAPYRLSGGTPLKKANLLAQLEDKK